MRKRSIVYQWMLGLLGCSLLLEGCGACNTEGGCDPQGCSVPDWVVVPGTFIADSAEIYVDECKTGLGAADLNGRTVRVVEKQPPMTDVDGNPQAFALDGDWRFMVNRVSIKCAAGWGYLDPATVSSGGCSWSSTRTTPFFGDSQDTWSLSLLDYRSDPMGTCWTGPSTCRIGYSFTLHRIGP